MLLFLSVAATPRIDRGLPTGDVKRTYERSAPAYDVEDPDLDSSLR
ncbi:MAG: hypothetical protein ACYC9L_08250 [Sulfuricaulis sp.]